MILCSDIFYLLISLLTAFSYFKSEENLSIIFMSPFKWECVIGQPMSLKLILVRIFFLFDDY